MSPPSEVGNSIPDRRQSVLVVTTTTLAITTLFVAGRLVSRVAIVKRASWDDYLIVIGWVLACGLTFSAAFGTSRGLGLHDANIPDEWVYPLRKCEYAFSVLYNPALMATKSSIITFYLRLSPNTHKLLRVASWTTLGVVNVAGLVLTLFNVFQCVPVSQVFAPAGKCIPLITLYLASAPVNVITDLAVLVLPIPVLSTVQLPRKQKIILMATFGLGVYVVATDLVRVYYLQQSSSGFAGKSPTDTSPLLGDEVDFAWYASLSFLWSSVEVNVGIICACVPTLKPLIGKILPILIYNRRSGICFGSFSKSSSNNAAVSTQVANGQSTTISSPTSPPRPVLMSNTDSLLVSRDPLDSFVAQPIQTLPSSVIANSQATPHASGRMPTGNSVFGFITLKRPRTMLRMSTKSSVKYCVFVSVLFFMCGLSHGLWNNLNNQISAISSNRMNRTLGLYSTYFGAYFFGPATVGQLVLRNKSFKATFITGLCIYGTGAFMFWPSAVLLSLTGFLLSNFVAGFGLSVIETAINPFIVLCGPAYYGEVRLLAAQGMETIGKVVGMVTAEKTLFQDVQDGPTLLKFQWIYIGIALSSTVLALIFYYAPLPEASDDDIQLLCQPGLPRTNQSTSIQVEDRFGKCNFRVTTVTLALGFCALFLYSGVQVCNGLWSSNVVGTPAQSSTKSKPAVTPLSYGIIATSSLAAGRFTFAALGVFVLPRFLLLISFVGALVFTILIFALTDADSNTLGALMIVLYFFEGPILPLIFATCLRRMGHRTKVASAILASTTGSAALFPWFVYAMIQENHRLAQHSYSLFIAFLAAGTLFPIYLSAFPMVRQQVDRGQKSTVVSTSGSPGSTSSPRNRRSLGNRSPPGIPDIVIEES